LQIEKQMKKKESIIMARYKRETLESKTVKDLRQLVVKLGIPGFTKKPKATIIDAIMAKYGVAGSGAAAIAKDGPAAAAPQPLQGIAASFQSSITKPNLKKRDRLSTTIQVSCGASTGTFPVAGRSVAEVGEFLREVLNVDKLSTGVVNGKEVAGDYVLKAGDTLEFLKPAGKKGC
jgi:hypothetical protein